MKKISFYQWLRSQWLRSQKNRNNVVGDIAKDALIDNKFPKHVTTSYNKIEKYLESRNANINVIESLKIAYEEYKTAYM
jgi:uncharacterized protein YozE (UPF0346 family)